MNASRDLGAALGVSAALLLVVGYLTQCAPNARRVVSDASAAATASPSRHAAAEEEERENERRPKSIREIADEEEHEEAEKIKNVAHALQTIGANPEMRATLGLPP
jgi:hypothetical protein